MSNQNPAMQLLEVAARIRDMRELLGYSMQKMAELTEVSEETYKLYESGTADLPFSFLLDLEAQIDTKEKPLDGRSLIIHGTLDTVVPPTHVLEYCSAHPKVRLHLMEGADHRFKNAGELDCICDTAIDFIYN